MKMLRDFRDFLLQGNILEIAIAFVIGTAFAILVASFVDNLIMPIVAAVIGKPDFRDLTFTINDSVFRYGAFLTDAIVFVFVVAAIFFFVVKPIAAIQERRSRGEDEEAVTDEERRHRELIAAIERSRA
jgi:large conductance mechanosensitive channel